VTRSTRGRRAEVAEVTASVQAAIAAGQFVPGELLPIPQLVRHFGVSAYPMVRSLLTLVADGYLIIVRDQPRQAGGVAPAPPETVSVRATCPNCCGVLSAALTLSAGAR
jgi:DNA-binding GntR family transcriptional regulator